MKYDIRRYWQALQWWYLYQYNKVTDSSSPLLNGLVAYWKLDETSDIRYDSTTNSNDLTDNNTVGSAPGKIGNAAEFVAANTEYLSIASNSDVSAVSTTSKTWAFWFNLNAVAPGFQILLSKDNGVSSREYGVLMSGDDLSLSWFSPTRQDIQFLDLSAGIWYFFVFWYDHVAGTINASINDGTVSSVGNASGNTATFTMFGLGDRPTGGSFPLDGLLDEFGIWDRVLSAAERTQLYNSGSGITYPFV